MATCRICLRNFTKLRFQSERISICGRCVNTLNESPEVAQHAEVRIGELLMRGIERNALRDLDCAEDWRRRKAQQSLADLGAAHAAALPRWLNRLLADPKNTKRDFKMVRANRRGLLHYDRPAGWGYPKNWREIASRIRRLDNYKCVSCAALDRVIDVHHIVYVSSFGTHQQSNLVALCRTCHESEHKRSFDFGEAEAEVDALQGPVPITPPVAANASPLPKKVFLQSTLQPPNKAVGDSVLHETFRKDDRAFVEAKRDAERQQAEKERIQREPEIAAKQKVEQSAAAIRARYEPVLQSLVVQRPFWQFWLGGFFLALLPLATVAPDMKEGSGFVISAILGAGIGAFIQSGSAERQKKQPKYVETQAAMQAEIQGVLKSRTKCSACSGAVIFDPVKLALAHPGTYWQCPKCKSPVAAP